jgi:formylglycine-generating enzyme required for sulfatase activity
LEIERAESVNALEFVEPLFQGAKVTLEQANLALKAEQYDKTLQLAAQAENHAREAYTVAAEFSKVAGKDGAPMVLIPAGEFLMGSDTGTSDEKPAHPVYLDAYYIDRFEVTVGRYRKFIEETGYPPPDWKAVKKYSPTDNCPIVLVSWHDAMAYAQWAGKTLPTEAQWEKAARGGLIQKDYPNGDSISHDDANYRRISTLGLTTGQTIPVNRYRPNGYGLYNMAGNVWEWCLDHYDKKYYQRGPKNNPLSIDEKKPNKDRVVRGGSWDSDNYDDRVLRCAYRNHISPSTKDITLGFRCVMKVPE